MIVPFEPPAKRTSQEVATFLRNFLTGSGKEWDWDDFVSIPIVDSELDRIRVRCLHLSEEFPPDMMDKYCSDAGMEIVREYLWALEQNRT